MASTTPTTRTRILVPAVLLALVAALLAIVLTSPPRTTPVPLGASAPLNGGLARLHGVIPTEADGWAPPTPAAALAVPPGEGVHRVRILLELTAMEEDGLSFNSSDYSVSALGEGTWEAVWFSPGSAVARQGESIDAVLVFELPDRAIDLTLDLPGGAGLSLGAGHHRSGR
ncbi:hypothetical protein E2F48_02565 [Arthrobacter crusticola]|uniref:DUF4352 domain-containing protein n=1 Tax=Arthrobacter crusticola TaxID=2547960 RepID=A0A4V3AN43_9MICC|nr:hypothetical protein [Arthrobacter crusticola]TDK28004.1 hypothetical protein E2F48_02565 [Arthrobacter crusticola]